jgi:hypothetical protein
MLVEFFNSLDPYRFFAEAPLFLIFFLPGLIVGAILYVMYRGLLTLTGEDEEVPFISALVPAACFIFGYLFIYNLSVEVGAKVGIAGGIPITIMVITAIALNILTTSMTAYLLGWVRDAARKAD